jgi:hypothetical protein
MKTIKVIMLTLLVAFLITIAYSFSHAEDGINYRIYTEIGGENVTEERISDGHKAYDKLGIEIILENMRAQMKFGLEGFMMIEAPEEDPEIPCSGAGASVEYAFKAKSWVFPYLGVRYDHISRGTAPKYDDPTDPEYRHNAQVESEHDIVSARGGVHLMYKWLYADLGTIIPFYTSTKSGNFDADLGVGVRLGNWDLGYKFRRFRMTDNHFSGDTALSFYFSGVELGYSF